MVKLEFVHKVELQLFQLETITFDVHPILMISVNLKDAGIGAVLMDSVRVIKLVS